MCSNAATAAAAAAASKQHPTRSADRPSQAHLLRPPLRPPRPQLGRTKRRRVGPGETARHSPPPPGWALQRGRLPGQLWTTRRMCACRQLRVSKTEWCCRPLVILAEVCLRCNDKTLLRCPVRRCRAALLPHRPSSMPLVGCPRHKHGPCLRGEVACSKLEVGSAEHTDGAPTLRASVSDRTPALIDAKRWAPGSRKGWFVKPYSGTGPIWP